MTAAVAALVEQEIAVPDTGSTRGDLLALMREAVEVYRGSRRAGVMPNLVSAMARDARAGSGRPRRVPDPAPSGVDRGARRGVERGDLRRDLDLELALDVLGGPLFYRLLITGGPIDEQLAKGVTELILRGFAPDEGPPDPERKGTAMKIHAIQTGTVAITTAWRRASATAGAAS